jgi:glyoxylase-like metal-dependent hydrolase (beta-lactamase superfamily II)
MTDRRFGRLRVLTGAQNGKYPAGNSLWIDGNEVQAVVDPSLTVSARGAEFADRAELVLLSHPHEDHVAGLHLFPRARVAMHHEDLVAARGIEGLMTIYGYGGELADVTRQWVTERFNYVARPDAAGFGDGAVFDLGGTAVRVFHAPGHTRGHCVLRIEPEGVLFLGDIELSSFGPYYGDAWSDLKDFERSLRLVREIDAEAWVSFHHVGVIERRADFLARLDRFEARIAEREDAMLAFLAAPRTLAEMVRHRFIYPPHADLPFIDAVERRSIEQHLARLARDGRVEPVADGAWVARSAAR